ncbi:lipid II flippase family protein [Paenibacillus sp. strain BS8-2]
MTAIYTIGVLAAWLASTYSTETSLTTSQSSELINGMATILLTSLIDPQIGLLTDKVLKGGKKIGALNKVFGLLMISLLLGIVMVQLLLVPAAH